MSETLERVIRGGSAISIEHAMRERSRRHVAADTKDALLTRDRTAEALTEDAFPVNRGGPKEKQKEPGIKAKRGTHIQAKQKKVAVARRRESDALTDREIVAARLARAIGRGYD